MESLPAASSSTSPATTSATTSTPSSPAASSTGGSLDSPLSAASGPSSVVPEHTPPRRRLVKASSIISKRDAGASGAAGGPPGFGVDRSSGTSPATASGTGSGPAGVPSGVQSSTSTSTFRERAGIRPLVKSDVQGEFPMMPTHGSGGSSTAAKLGRSAFVPNPGMMGDVRPLGRRFELTPPRRHEGPSPALQKHVEDVRIQQNKRACLTRAQNMGATGNYKNFDSPFGNYMVPVIPNHLFKTPITSSPAPTSPSNSSPGVSR